MFSPRQPCGVFVPALGISSGTRTEIILAATLLFLLFASLAMLMAAQTPLHGGDVEPSPSGDLPAVDPAASKAVVRARSRNRRGAGTLGVLLGLLGSVALFAICAW
jgi:hypothetical protein